MKNGQQVQVICGKDKGKKGQIIESKPYSKKKRWEVILNKWYKYKPN